MQLPRIDRAVKSMLMRVGDLDPVNSLGVSPPEFSYVSNVNSYVGRAQPGPASPTPAFTAVDAGAVAAANYDEVVIDSRPTVSPAGEVTTNGGSTPELYRSLLIANTPFWFVVRCTGYGVSSMFTRDKALAVAIKAIDALWTDANTYTLTPLLKGFAFVGPDLNVVFPDGTAIDRRFQSALVQQCRSHFRAAMFVTSRPNDVISLVAPLFALPEDPEDPVNPNSGLPLPYPIIGDSPQFNDRIVALYPNVALDDPSMSLVLSQVQSLFSARARDAGFPLNMSYGYVVPIDGTQWSADGIVGSQVSGDALSRLSRFAGFLAALGVPFVGIQSGPSGDSIPVPQDFLPPDDLFNSSGGAACWSSGAVLHVAYLNDAGRVHRAFAPDFTEVPT